MTNNKIDKKKGGLNFIIIGFLSALYILLVNKLAEIVSNGYDEEERIETYAMIIYIISIMGIAIGYVWLSDKKIDINVNNSDKHFIFRTSLNIGGVLLLLYTMINYWEFLGDYAKLGLIALSMICIIYYVYLYH
jgi:ABC-type Fe3+ transport system permease subunit